MEEVKNDDYKEHLEENNVDTDYTINVYSQVYILEFDLKRLKVEYEKV